MFALRLQLVGLAGALLLVAWAILYKQRAARSCSRHSHRMGQWALGIAMIAAVAGLLLLLGAWAWF